MTSKITSESYVFKFGKFINMKACDVARLTKVDKYGNDVNVGLQYLEFLVDKCDWFRHKDIITQVIHEAKKNIKEPEDAKKMPGFKSCWPGSWIGDKEEEWARVGVLGI